MDKGKLQKFICTDSCRGVSISIILSSRLTIAPTEAIKREWHWSSIGQNHPRSQVFLTLATKYRKVSVPVFIEFTRLAGKAKLANVITNSFKRFLSGVFNHSYGKSFSITLIVRGNLLCDRYFVKPTGQLTGLAKKLPTRFVFSVKWDIFSAGYGYAYINLINQTPGIHDNLV